MSEAVSCSRGNQRYRGCWDYIGRDSLLDDALKAVTTSTSADVKALPRDEGNQYLPTSEPT